MRPFLIHFKKLDWVIIISVLLLVGIGLLSIYSSSLAKKDFLNFKKQIIFLTISFFLMIFFSFFDWRIFRENPYLILFLYFFCLISLIGLFFFAPEIKGAKGWYRLGPISIDPIEFTKIILIILLAKYFSMRHVEMYRIGRILISGFYMAIPAILIFFQPDLGSVLILIILWVGILIISGIKVRHFLILCLSFLLILILIWSFFLKDYQRQRIISFFQPRIEPLGTSWSGIQAKIAIGAGSIFGQGLGSGSQVQYGFLPEPQTDFIFSAIAEEMGILGIGVIFFLFSFLVWRILKIAMSSRSNFPRLFASGLAILLVSQIFIHIGMNLGIIPIIGIPLPLISYGGSSLISNFISLGILQSFKVH
ncbi:rod shape-determining protein RodA [Patescibacteria group bacterium]|nr:rod shape-determining protein RodA [Patescibacteria group bacterium]